MGTAHTLDEEMLLRYAARQLIDDAEPERNVNQSFFVSRSKLLRPRLQPSVCFVRPVKGALDFFTANPPPRFPPVPAMQRRTQQAGPEQNVK